MAVTSAFKINLDTTGPEVEINSPQYTTASDINEITITANEAVAGYQNIYIIDSKKVRHNLLLAQSGNSFNGNFLFSNYPFGIATIYAQIKDDVGNFSPIASKTIRIIPNVLDLYTGDATFTNISIDIKDGNVDNSESYSSVLISDSTSYKLEIKDE